MGRRSNALFAVFPRRYEVVKTVFHPRALTSAFSWLERLAVATRDDVVASQHSLGNGRWQNFLVGT